MLSTIKFGIGGSRNKIFVEWECCGLTWQLQMWVQQMFRWNWFPICPKCGQCGISYRTLKHLDNDPWISLNGLVV